MASLTGTTITGTLSATTFSANGSGITSIQSGNLAGTTLVNAQLNANMVTRDKINHVGAVLQTIVRRYDGRPGYSGPTNATNGGTQIGELRLTITPTYSNSLIVCEWWIHGESNSHDAGWHVMRDSSGNVNNPGGEYAGFNTDTGQNNHSFISSEFHDNDTGSTPTCSMITYYDRPGNTSTHFYDPVYGSSDGGTRTFFINRTVGSGGQNNHENGVSFGRITEIKQ